MCLSRRAQKRPKEKLFARRPAGGDPLHPRGAGTAETMAGMDAEEHIMSSTAVSAPPKMRTAEQNVAASGAFTVKVALTSQQIKAAVAKEESVVPANAATMTDARVAEQVSVAVADALAERDAAAMARADIACFGSSVHSMSTGELRSEMVRLRQDNAALSQAVKEADARAEEAYGKALTAARLDAARSKIRYDDLLQQLDRDCAQARAEAEAGAAAERRAMAGALDDFKEAAIAAHCWGRLSGALKTFEQSVNAIGGDLDLSVGAPAAGHQARHQDSSESLAQSG